MSPQHERVAVSVEGHELTLSNLGKVLFSDGSTKGEVLDYYAHIAPVMLAHLRGRPVTVRRYPDGAENSGFIEKNVPRGAPAWVKTVTLPRRGTRDKPADRPTARQTTEHVVVDDLATLTWLANLAAIEFHTHQWRVSDTGTPQPPDLAVFDLDPGPPAAMAECARIALVLRDRLAQDGLRLLAKTSGSKGLQCYARIASKEWPTDRSRTYAHEIAQELEEAHPDAVVSRMATALRPGKIFIDWGQNNVAKTTVTAYSLRARHRPMVSTPVEWEEVESAANGALDLLQFTPHDVLERVERKGDLFSDLLG